MLPPGPGGALRKEGSGRLPCLPRVACSSSPNPGSHGAGSMELKRGKTFIKSSLHISHEKPPGTMAPAPARDHPGTCSVSPGGQQQAPGEGGPQAGSSTHGCPRGSNKGAQPDPEGGAPFKLVWKSKTQDSAPGASRTASAAGHLVGSASFPGPSGGQRMIDYRHSVPQAPFVPAVAKSLPRKRVSLKRPKKCFRNLFHLRRNKTENPASLASTEKGLPSPRSPPEARGRRGQAFAAWGEGLGLDGLCPDLSDGEVLPDAPYELCRALCEDVASLKSFDSLTGCGEIFADESSLPPLILDEGLPGAARAPQASDSKVPRGPAQDQNEVLDLAQFWDSVNHCVWQQRRALLGPRPEGPPGTGPAQLPLWPCRDPLSSSKASPTDTGTPKSEQPESLSTSDEGYYDAFSPSLEDRQGAPSPGTPTASLPRESYSGDALYELFCDPSEGPVGPGLDDGDLCVSESLSGPALGAPLSMCSFHVGADENPAPGPGPDLLSQGFSQSSWRGKECLLKLCDTELAITMGIVNWLRRGPELRAAPAPAPGEPAPLLRGLAGSERKGPSPGKLEGGVAVGSAPGRQEEQRVGSDTTGLLTGESQASAVAMQGPGPRPRDRSVTCVPVLGEAGARGCHEGSLSPAGSAASVATDTPGKDKVITPLAWPHSQEPPGHAGCPHNWRRPGLRGSPPETEPTLVGCAAQVAALQIHPRSETCTVQPPGQDTSSGLCRKPWVGDRPLLPQNRPDSPPGGAATQGRPSATGPPHGPQAPKCPGLVLDLRQPGLQPAQARVPAQGQPL
ncbi:APC membrane recruitment protein 3 [Sturnira hondurensis]|uniref:APC membrane recruitment protein 3 n=1 Tax=Sturnira hondurensis TaxID=192404 RepID=UPI00187AC110|nr:APC membrane recruitment protein 3 [Sturnira hondurensis]